MPSNGSIQFRVFTSNASIPVEGATVVVRRQDPPYQLLGIQATDRSGQTPILSIMTEGTSSGQTPEADTLPWVNLIAYIEHPAYEEAAFRGIQLFPGVLTIQNVQLIPNQYLDPQEADLQQYNTTPQPIWNGGTA